MKLPRVYSLQEISQMINARFSGAADFKITGINEIHMVEEGDITFVDFEKYYGKALHSAATTIIINKEVPCPEGKTLIFSDDPFRDYNKLTAFFKPLNHPKVSNYIMGTEVSIGEDTYIHNGVVLGNHVRIGKNCIIYPNVVIYDHTVIGDNVIIHANSVIGGDAFYYKRRPDGYDKMHSCGVVIIENDVEIGAGVTIDRGVSGNTVVGKGTKIDNQVQIGHDTIIGNDCIIGSQSGIAGVTKIEDNVILWGQVGVTKDIVIGKGAVVSAKSGVSKSLQGGKSYFGVPAREHRKVMQELAAISRLPQMIEEFKRHRE